MKRCYSTLVANSQLVNNVWDKTPSNINHKRCGQMLDNVLYIHLKPDNNSVLAPKPKLACVIKCPCQLHQIYGKPPHKII